MSARAVSLFAYRVAKAKYPPFEGTGAARVGGRWNSPGREVIYCSRSYAGALLEILVQAGLGRLPGRHHCVAIEIPDHVPAETVSSNAMNGWDQEDQVVSRMVGDRWLAQGRSAVLVVPSLVARPYEQNVLINPAHPEARHVRTGEPVTVRWDVRLFHAPV